MRRKIKFNNEVLQKLMAEKLISDVSKSTEPNIEIKSSTSNFNLIESYEFKDEILRSPRTQDLVDKVQIIEVSAEKGTIVKAKNATSKLSIIDGILGIKKEIIDDIYKPISWNLKEYACIFDTCSNFLEDSSNIEKDLFNVVLEITRNTENDFIYNQIIKEPINSINITPEKTGEQVRTELKDFCNSITVNQKRIYISFSLFDKLKFLSKKLNISLITDNPNILGGKLLCGVPIEAFENNVLKPHNQKELIICGDLYGAIALFRKKNYEFDNTNALTFGNTSFRIIQSYDCKKGYNDIVVGEINL